MKKSLIIILILIALGIIGFVITRSSNNQSADSSGESSQSQSLGKAPDFHLQDFNGKTVSLADFKGKPLIINSWAAWCPFCRKELPDFAAVQKELGDKVVIIAIDRAESVDTQKRYTNELGVTSDLIFLQDSGDTFYQSIGGFSMPETIFVDKDGNIRDHKRGPMDQVEISERIKKILN